MGKLTKNRKSVIEKIDNSELYSLEEACTLLKDITTTKFDSSVDLAIRLGVDPKKANEMIKERFFDLIIVMIRISDIDPFKFSKRLKLKYPQKPIVLLAFDQSEIKHISKKDKMVTSVATPNDIIM